MVVRALYRSGRSWSRIVFEALLEQDAREVQVPTALDRALAIARHRREGAQVGTLVWIEDAGAPALRVR